MKKGKHKRQLNHLFTPEMSESPDEFAAATHMNRTKFLEDLFWDYADTAAQGYMQRAEQSLPRVSEAFLARKRARVAKSE